MKKKVLYFLLAVFLLLAVSVALLPVLLSSGSFLRFALSRVNTQAAPSRLQIDSCSIGWKKGLECRNIRYLDPHHGLDVTVPRLSDSQGLLALLVAPKNLGVVSIDDPGVILSDAAAKKKGAGGAGGPEKTRTEKQQTAESKSPPAAESATQGRETPFWENMRVRLLVKGGSVRTRFRLQQPRVVVRDLQLTSGLSDGSIAYTLGLQAGEGDGRIAATGFVNLPVRQDALLDALVSMVDLQITDFQVRGLLAAAASRGNLPTGQGLLSGSVSLKTAGLDNLKLKGQLELSDLRLQGGFLGADQPSFARVDLILDSSSKAGEGWTVTRCDLTADPGAVKASGRFGQGTMALRAKGQLELPVLFDRFPTLLRMRQGTTMSSGVLDFSVDLADTAGRMTMDVNSTVEQLSGEYEKRPFVWSSPLVLTLKAEKSGQEVQVRDLHLTSSFLKASGSGDLKAFSLQASADLQEAFRELGQLFDLPWTGTGKLALHASSSDLGDNRYAMDLDAKIADFSLLHGGEPVLPAHGLDFSAHLRGSPEALSGRGSMDVRLNASGWPGRIQLTADNIVRKDKDLAGRYRLSTSTELGRLTELLHTLDLLPRQTAMTGAMHLAASGFLGDGTLVVRELDSSVDKLFLHSNGISYRDDLLHLFIRAPAQPHGVPIGVRKMVVSGSPEEFSWTGSGHSAVNFTGRGLYLRHLVLQSALGDFTTSYLGITDWQRPLETLAVTMDGDLALARLSTLLHDLGALNSDMTVDGKAGLAVQIQSDDKGDQRITFDLESDPLTLARAEKKLLAHDNLKVSAKLKRNAASEDVVFNRLALQSRPLTLEASGLLRRDDTTVFDLQGSVTPDLQALAPVVEAMTGTHLVMAGRKTEKFSLHLPLGVSAEELRRKAELSLALWAEKINYSGVDLSDLNIPVQMKDGILQLSVQSGLNGGKLDIDPVCTFTATPPVLTIADNSRILTGVELQQPLVDGVLSKIHPLFGILARPTGTMDMELTTFSWPLVDGGADQARFKAEFDVSRVNLDSTGVLREVLTLAGLEKEKLKLKDSRITCNGADGRITCTPVRILVAGSEMVISGSVGMDRTLDYLLQVPVTENLVGREGYRVLAGTTLKVPVKGTLGEPIFNRNMLSAAVSDLAKQAAGKAIEKQIEKALPKLFEGLLKK